MSGRSFRAQDFSAVIFDLDGVVTKTARVHAAAWKRLFDAFLQERAARQGEAYKPFSAADYLRYLDGKPRYDGVRSFLASRGIDLPAGSPEDSPDRETVCGLGNRKNDYFHLALEEQGVEVYPGTLSFIRQLQAQGIRTAIISASRNCASVLEKAGVGELFEEKVDGLDAAALDLPGKPAPDVFLEAARRLGLPPARCAIVEDALAGVRAGAAGGFGCVIGVDRGDQAAELQQAGADLVVSDLGDLIPRMGGG